MDKLKVNEHLHSMETNTSTVDIAELNERIAQESAFIELLNMEVQKKIVGQSKMMNSLLIGLLGNGHILLEGVPGLAKTLAIKSLSEALDGDFSRVQFTPDLLPSDVIGTQVYNIKEHEFSIKKGPVFANFVLADEINRAPAKVQSALLEAMQERQVTIGGETMNLPKPFLVLATQNPVEQEGTYPLPEAQVDRFMLKVFLGYPSKDEEKQIIRANVRKGGLPECLKVMSAEDILRIRQLVREVYLDEKIEQYIVDLVCATRTPEAYGLGFLQPMISFGCSPRASINLALAAKAYAFLQGRAFVVPDDVKAVSPDVMRHRMGLTYEAEAENLTITDVVTKIVNKVEVP